MSISLALRTPHRQVSASATFSAAVATALRYGVQFAILWVVLTAGSLLSTALRLPLPGNLTGMLLLLAALWSGVLPLEWVADLAGLLVMSILSCDRRGGICRLCVTP